MVSVTADQDIRVEVLTKDHDISGFISSSKDLTEYFWEDALEDTLNKTAITHVLSNDDRQIVGFFTLLNDRIEYHDIGHDDRIRDYNYRYLPALKIGRISSHKDHEGEGLGTMMLTITFSYLFNIIRYSGCRIITVDSKKGCEGFYEKHGFKSVRVNKNDFTPMYMNMGRFIKEQYR
jgi:GNAT superfamily N-acetyltransferase